ncbi:glycosyltransferase [Methylophilus sp. QUAN]|uniref:glycosyltransferase n=1 Tax=Methylophilus sp. QUAN TaxID=2781020 RepID=UPI0018901D51|nr:glycosyltransferase [Methylophilus sp. QUAN]MBF4990618.1 glycosyltransferase [Methylophilus sp. QUAN]
MNKPKVSIVIPVYNGEDYLKQAIESALEQTYQNIEILVINDGSTDNGETDRIAKSYGSNIRYLYKENGGVASALNLAIREMQGEYFSWLSHDDLYSKDKVEKQILALANLAEKNVVIYSNYSVFTDDLEKASPVQLSGVRPESFRYWITIENRLHGCTLLIPKQAFDKVGVFNESLRTTQDYDLWFRMAKQYDFVHIPDVLVQARQHANQGSYQMAGIALTECNQLLSNFAMNLSHKEILSGSGKSLSESYTDLASSMFNRGFNEAGASIKAYAISNKFMTNNKTMTIKREIRYFANKLISICRQLVPANIKTIIKRLFSKSNIQAKINRIDLKEKFSEIYDKNIFGGRESRSGEGSDLVQTKVIREQLPKIIEMLSVKTFLDAPCGDWYWMKETELRVQQYIGVDIVEPMINKHMSEFGGATRTFKCLNLAEDTLPKADLIFSRDCLVHLKFDDALKILRNFKQSGAKYLLTTTFTDRSYNNDLIGQDSFWRALNMQLAPFYFPEPILTINEGCTEEAGQFQDKSLGLWLLSDINI